MLPQYATEQLIEDIKSRCAVPTSQLTYTEAAFVKLADKNLKDRIVPLIMTTREEYFVESFDVEAPADGVIDMPEHAIGAKLRSVCYVQQAANPVLLINLPRIDLDVVAGIGFVNNVSIAGFYVENNTIRLYPNTSVPANTLIRLYFYRRRLTLIEPAEYGQVVAVDSGSLTIQLDRVPTDWAVGTELNSVYSQPNFATTNDLMTVTAVSTPSIVVDTVEGVSVGDYISEYGFSAIPQLPIEAHAYLAQLTAITCLRGLGDKAGADDLKIEAEELKTGLITVVSQRVDGSVKKVINPNGGLRLGSKIGRWGWYRGGF